MGLTMKKILDRFNNCDVFSLTGKVSKYNIKISKEEYEKTVKNMNPMDIEKFLEQFKERYNIKEEEFLNALAKVEEKDKEKNRKIYDKNKDKLINYPEFNKLYDEIKKECYDFYCDENKEYYLNKHYNDEKIEQFKKIGITEEKISKMKEDFFHCSLIVDHVGKNTKYGKENKGFFWHLYHDIAMTIDREKDKEKYCINNGKSPLNQIPSELKNHLLYYEVSYFNEVTISGGLMINYYFKLNKETKKYLLKFRNDFCINEFEDLTFYKANEVKFSSCTHERFNSIEFNYKNMKNDEIVDFIYDEYYEENNDKVIEIINKLIKMESNTKFSFKEIGINDKNLMNKICSICDKINLCLISSQNISNSRSTINENGNVEKIRELPAILCNLEDIIEKKQ